MNHKLYSILLVLLLLAMVVVIGLLTNLEGFTGAITVKSVACYSDGECDDKIQGTEDICRNPGTEYSICVNRLKNNPE